MEFYPSILKHANQYLSSLATEEKALLSEAGEREQKKQRAESDDSKSSEARPLYEDSGTSTSTPKTPSPNSK